MSLFSEPIGKVFYHVVEEVMLSLYLINHHAIKAHLGNRSTASRILSLDSKWKWMVSVTSLPFLSEEILPVPFNRRLDRKLNHSYRFKVEGNFLTLPWIEPHSLATLLAETAGFLAKGSRDFTDSELPAVSHLVVSCGRIIFFCVLTMSQFSS
jgi:hypothetical protein